MTASTSAITESHADLLEAPLLAHVATVGPAGEPQSNPVWFDWDGHQIRIAIAPFRQKYRNLQRDSRIALSIVDPNVPGRYLEIRGRVAGFEPDSDYAFTSGLFRKYTGTETMHGIEGERHIVVIEPIHTSSMG